MKKSMRLSRCKCRRGLLLQGLVAVVLTSGVRGAGEEVRAADLVRDPNRPQLRYTPRAGWVNDPNGLTWQDGEWRFFYQHNPTGPKWGNLHWGYAVSTNLVDWEEREPAMAPDATGMMFSGCGVVDRENTAGFGKGAHVLIYTAAGQNGKPFTQCLAFSRDGRRYEKYAGNPVIPQLSPQNRDPKVFWHAPTRAWVMALYGEEDRRHVVWILTSPDLKSWTKRSTVVGGETAKAKKDTWLYECPGLEELKVEGEDKTAWALWGADNAYAVGSFDGAVFRPEAERIPGVLTAREGGMPYYAAQTYADAPGGRAVWVAWYRLPTRPGSAFTHAFSLPQELTLRRTPQGLRLVRRQARELAALRDGAAVPFARFDGELAEIDVACALAPDGRLALDLRGVPLVYDSAKGTLAVAGRTFDWPLDGGRLAFKAFLDRVGLEIFSADGLRMAAVPEAFPNPSCRSLAVTARTGVGEASFMATPLRSVWASRAAVTVTADPTKVLAEVPRTLYGTGMEDVNHEIYGGLDAQRLYDESFEEQEIEPTAGKGIAPKPGWVCGRQWTVSATDGGRVAIDRRTPHLGAVAVSLEPGRGTAAVANAGLNGWGVPCRAGRRMSGHFFARGSVGELSVALRQRGGGETYARTAVALQKTDGWQRVDFALSPTDTDAAAEFIICASGGGRVLVDDAYLADEPTNAFGKLGCREDIVDALRQEGLTFLRWGGSMANAWGYLWKDMKDDRRPYDGFWSRTSSTGFLYREFVRMAAEMKLPCAFSVYAYEQVGRTAEIAEWLKPFGNDIYVQVGNEECAGCTPTCGEFTLGDCRRYCESLRLIVTEMRKANPRLKFVSALMYDRRHQALMDEGFRLTDGYADYWDLHLRVFGPDVAKVVADARADFAAFRDMVRRLNPQSRMKVAVFEENGNEHGLRRALSHAAVLGVCREQGDFLLTSCPANALQPWRQNDNGWDQGQIFFTPDRVWLQPCAWAQQMAAASHRDLLVPGASDDPDVLVSATRNRAGDSLVLHLVNVSPSSKSLTLALADGPAWKVACVTSLSGDGPLAANTPEEPLRVAPKDVTAAFRRQPGVAGLSYTVVELVRTLNLD